MRLCIRLPRSTPGTPCRSYLIAGTFPHTFLYLSGLLVSLCYIPIAYTLPCLFSLKLLVGGCVRDVAGQAPTALNWTELQCQRGTQHCLHHRVAIYTANRVGRELPPTMLPPLYLPCLCRARGSVHSSIRCPPGWCRSACC